MLNERAKFVLNVIVVVLGLLLILIHATGCQVGLSAEVQTYWPDEAGNDKKIGDPRKNRYQFGNTSATEKVQSVESSSRFNTLPDKKGGMQ